MLVIKRKIGERIIMRCAGREIVVTLNSVEARKAQIGIDAPPDVSVDREEIRIDKDRDERKRGA